MAQSGLVISRVWGSTVVTFQERSILDGRVVDAIATELYDLVDGQAERRIALDFKSVEYMSSLMLSVLVTMHRSAARIKGRVVLCGLRPELVKLLKLSNLDKLMTVVKTEEEALRVLNSRR